MLDHAHVRADLGQGTMSYPGHAGNCSKQVIVFLPLCCLPGVFQRSAARLPSITVRRPC